MAQNNHQSQFIDLRSDTVTRPNAAMYEAMQNAPLGDDVLGDDPTVQRLQSLAAELLGKEAALFVPSGTMGNQIAIATHCNRGDAIIVEEEAHILYYEVGATGVIAGAVSWTLPSQRGAMDPEMVEKRILKASDHTPGTSLVCVENTHNRAGGAIIPQGHLAAYRNIVDRHGVKLHMDGARVFNAAVAQNLPVREIARYADSVSFCLSKGLGSPVGSLLVGSNQFIEKAHVWRKRLGGGMRQAGVLAACGVISLTQMIDRLADDHRRAKALAGKISGLPGLQVDLDGVQTNMIMVNTKGSADTWQDRLEEAGLLCFSVSPHRLRLVFHVDVDDEKAERAGQIFTALAN